MSYGFVYILANSAMPGVYKVGFTSRSPSMRAAELSRSTSVPADFDLVCYAEYADARGREAEIHALLSDFRESPDREFFRCDLLEIADLVMDEEAAYSVCHHQIEPYLYSESKKYRQRCRVVDHAYGDLISEVARRD